MNVRKLWNFALLLVLNDLTTGFICSVSLAFLCLLFNIPSLPPFDCFRLPLCFFEPLCSKSSIMSTISSTLNFSLPTAINTLFSSRNNSATSRICCPEIVYNFLGALKPPVFPSELLTSSRTCSRVCAVLLFKRALTTVRGL